MKVMLSLQKTMTINLISARLSKYIYLIQSWTILFVKKIETKIEKKKKNKHERSLFPKCNRFVSVHFEFISFFFR